MCPKLKTSKNSRKRVLLLYGGWREHSPKRVADFAVNHLLGDFDVVRSHNLRMLRSDVLWDSLKRKGFDYAELHASGEDPGRAEAS